MDIQFYGANCVTLTTKNARVVIDDNLSDLGGKTIAKAGDIALFTGAHGVPEPASKITIDQPGEYEVSGISIYGISARSHMDEEGMSSTTMYKLVAEDLRILIAGHIHPDLSSAQLEAIGMVDVMIIPVGGNGYTLDGVGALKVVKEIEPKVIIPTHYNTKGLTFPVPQQPLEEALKGLAMEPKEAVAKLKLKHSELSDAAQLVVLEKS